jgi:DNA repair protein RadC
MSKIKNLPKHKQPREKLIEKGAENLRDSELMAILLRTGTKGKDVMKVSREVLRKNPTKNLLALNFKDLAKIKGIGPGKACLLLAAFELTKRALEVEDNNLPTIISAKDAVAQLQELRTMKKEHFVVLYLNARNQLIHKETVSIGTLNASLIHPREVFKSAIDHLAASVILAHNHPSGSAEPSEDDLEVTKRLKEAGRILGIEVLDHVIITKNAYSSLKEKKLLTDSAD